MACLPSSANARVPWVPRAMIGTSAALVRKVLPASVVMTSTSCSSTGIRATRSPVRSASLAASTPWPPRAVIR